MKEVIVHVFNEVTTEIHEIPIPVPGSDEVVIKVVVAGSNPKGLFPSVPFIGNYVDTPQIGSIRGRPRLRSTVVMISQGLSSHLDLMSRRPMSSELEIEWQHFIPWGPLEVLLPSTLFPPSIPSSRSLKGHLSKVGYV
jgi:hypothetical protein